MYYLRKDQRTPSPQTRCPVTSPNLSEPLLRRERQKKRRRRRRGNVAPAAAAVAAVAARCSDFRSFSGLLRDFTSNRVSKAHLLRHLLVFNEVCLAAAWRVLLTVLTCGAAFVLLADSVVVCPVCCVRFRVTRLLGLLQRLLLPRLLARLPRNLLLRFFKKNPLLS